MKRKTLLIAAFLALLSSAFAKPPLEYVKEKYTEYAADKIESIGTVGSLSLFVLVREQDWFEEAVFFDAKTNEITNPKEITELGILSARVVKTKKESFFEIVGITHMGHGNIYLFDAAGKRFFSYGFVDRHLEDVDYPDYGKIPCLRETVRSKLFHLSEDFYDGYSAVFENDTLNRDYTKYDEGILRIFGRCKYVGYDWETGASKVFGSDEIERIFVRTDGEWSLAKSKGSMENLPYLEPDNIFDLWEY